ncbi:unnamed protein product [Didymodactylos carnosus]|uniref:Uncharacterized protein n=1 Tax=Didymodactylos carnosus TaxID=1234261 RepID=A0A8S2RR51_9BILA|nr:unnamed protein product [Didymodactylos carnosus]CAF4178627.1 unnamed protein product [Didymodactylos carnosus]
MIKRPTLNEMADLVVFHPQQQTQSSISVEPFNRSQQNFPMAQPTSSSMISTATVNTNDTLPQQSSPADDPLVYDSNLIKKMNSLWMLFTSFVSNIADNPSSLLAVVPSNVIDSLVPSSSAVQPSKFICYSPKHHTLQSTFSLSNEEFESVYDVPASKRFCAHPQQTTTTPSSNQRKPPLQLASASKFSTKKTISVKGPIHFPTNNVLEDDNDERISSQVSITTPNQ